MMSGIRSRNTKPEVLTRKALHKLGYRFSLKSKVGKIKPDIVLRSRKVAVFTHGCYWHQHKGCKLAYSDRKYSGSWVEKFKANIERDERVKNQLLSDEWRVAGVWECSTRNAEQFEIVMTELDSFIKGNKACYESHYKKK